MSVPNQDLLVSNSEQKGRHLPNDPQYEHDKLVDVHHKPCESQKHDNEVL